MKINPFPLQGFFGKEYFCDRKTELQTLHENVANGRNTVIHAWRRLGKTALIKCLIKELEVTKNWETIYIDLLSTKTEEEAIKSMINGIQEYYGKTEDNTIWKNLMQLFGGLGLTFSIDPITNSLQIEVGFRQQISTEQSLSKIGEFLKTRKKNVLIVFDEFQQIAKYDEKGSTEAIFRSFMQNNPEVRFIYSGSERNLINSMFLDSNRPFYKSCSLLALEPIAPKAYFPFIIHHFQNDGQQIAIDVLQNIYDWSRGQTYSIQLICNRLYASPEENSMETLKWMEKALLMEEALIFANYSNLLTTTQWNVLKAIALSEPLANPQSKEFITRHHLGAASTVSTALKALLNKEMVIQEETHYLVHDVQFARWLQSL